MDDSNSKMDSLTRWRREKVWELKSCGLTMDEIAETLKLKEGIRISHGTVHRDLSKGERN
jgi:DNA-binding NarL/FixJ family response regulator